MQAAADVFHEEADHTPKQFPTVSISQSALIVHGRLEDSTPTWDLDLRFLHSQRKFLTVSF